MQPIIGGFTLNLELKKGMNKWVIQEIEKRGWSDFVNKDYMDWCGYLQKIILKMCCFRSEQDDLFQSIFFWAFVEPGNFWKYDPDYKIPLPRWFSTICERKLWQEVHKLQRYYKKVSIFNGQIEPSELIVGYNNDDEDKGFRGDRMQNHRDRILFIIENDDIIKQFREYLEVQKASQLLLFIFDAKLCGYKDYKILDLMSTSNQGFNKERKSKNWITYWKKKIICYLKDYINDNPILIESLAKHIYKKKRRAINLEQCPLLPQTVDD